MPPRPSPRPGTRPAPACIRLRGVRQNNLKGFDLDIPLGRYVVVTGLSGAGKSSLVFDTLHAEGQRRYVETFSAYTRQFLDLLEKPKVDSIENIRPSIAIGQSNTVRTSRSTVGTMTELTDYFKVWFSHAAACFDPDTGEAVEDDDPRSIWRKALAAAPGRTAVLAFEVRRPANLAWTEILASLRGQGFLRVLVPVPSLVPVPAPVPAAGDLTIRLVEDLASDPSPLEGRSSLFVAQDRLSLDPAGRDRFVEAAESALHFGKGEIRLFDAGTRAEIGRYSRGLHCPSTGRTFRPPTPPLFSFNSPLGACPRCRGFGRVIEIDLRLVIPDASLSIDQGAIRCWEGDVYGSSKEDLRTFAARQGIPTDIPFSRLTPSHRAYVLDGEPGYGEENGKTWPDCWYGVKGFFRWLEKNTYKMHVRVFLSRYRSYNTCPDCGGTRLQPEALCWRWRGRSLPDLYRLPVDDLLAEMMAAGTPPWVAQAPGESPASLALEAIFTRLRYLQSVGLGYLTLDRASRTLSGGEIERVNLAGCLGTSLVDTLFVLDEPSVGLHARDVDRLVAILRSLTDAGNTVVVVEHDEAMIRAADHVIEVGPEPGARGGRIVFQGDVPGMLAADGCLTGAYLSGRMRIGLPEARRPVPDHHPRLEFVRATRHNLRDLTVRLPLGRFVCVSGVSGSGKSTLLDNVVHQGLQAARGLATEDAAAIAEIRGAEGLAEFVLVDQSPLSRTPRSNPALYAEAWDSIRELFAATPAARAAGLGPSSFSFNAGDGRCDHCKGLGYERVEMQFLSDVFVPCGVCEGKRFKPEVLAIEWNGRSVADVLALPVSEALPYFAGEPAVARRLEPLEAVGLGYLALGQPLNTLSGGESQRLKLVRYLGSLGEKGRPAEKERGGGRSGTGGGALILLDEPTTGLHRHDVGRLLGVFARIVDGGHSLVVIEHNLDVLKSADWVLEIGPEAGDAGGRLVAEGPPEVIARSAAATAPFLRAALGMKEGPAPVAADGGGPDPIGSDSDQGPNSGPDSVPGRVSSVRGTPGGSIVITGARENNLKNLSLEIPHRALTVVTGVSGSGKSTLAFDIVFAEGQRRFMESMSPYARQFVEQRPRPALDRLSGIPPTVAIEQRITRGSHKSTVATITEVAQYLRLLYARLGVQHHPDTGRPVTPLSRRAIAALLAKWVASPEGRRARRLHLCAPLVRGRKGHHQPIADWIGRQGYEYLRADGRILRVDQFKRLDRYVEHDIEAVVGDPRAVATPGALLDEALRLGKGTCLLATTAGQALAWFSTTRTDAATGESFPELDPKHFSFNSPRGWCPGCRGHGKVFPWMLEDEEEEKEEDGKADEGGARFLRQFGIGAPDDVSENGTPCPVCAGERLNRISRAVRLHFRRGRPALSLPELLRNTPADLLARLHALDLDPRGRLIAADILPQIEERLKFLGHVGLGYLPLERATATLSGGEAQRIRLAAQLGTNLAGVLYVLDEPSIGLHARDNRRLIATLETLRDKGNTLLVVEHDDELMEHADLIVDLGPGAGIHGGAILASGTPAEIRRCDRSLTGIFLARGGIHPVRGSRRPVGKAPVAGRGGRRAASPAEDGWLELRGARLRNLAGFDLRIPIARLTVAAGPSGAGKSTLFRDLLRPAVSRAVAAGKARLPGREAAKAGIIEDAPSAPTAGGRTAPGRPNRPPPFDELLNAHRFGAVIEVDQAPIGKTPRSTPATYLGIFDLIRPFFASLPESRMRGHTASRFSFNTSGGRCAACEGAGRIRLEMAFMPDTYLPCDECQGRRYGRELDDIRWKGRSIGDVLALTFEEAAGYFDFHPALAATCRLMTDCGLGYLTLGQSSPTLSGGEAQRLKLVAELARAAGTSRSPRAGPVRNLYILEEPTIGLHMSDCDKLVGVLHSLVDQGHTVIVIEHNLDVIAEADYVVELGPGGGPEGGRLLHQGSVEALARLKGSPTGPFLRGKLAKAGSRRA